MLDVARTLPWCYPFICGSCDPVRHHGALLHAYVTTAFLFNWSWPGAGAGCCAGWVVVLESARRPFHRRVRRLVAADWARARAIFAELCNGDFVRDRYMYLPSIGFSILAAVGCGGCVTEGLECAGGSVLRGGGAVQRLCVCIAGAAGLLGKRSAAARARTVAVPGIPTPWRVGEEYSQRGAHEKAIALAEATVRDHPEYGMGRWRWPESYIHAGRYEEGRQWLERVNPGVREVGGRNGGSRRAVWTNGRL